MNDLPNEQLQPGTVKHNDHLDFRLFQFLSDAGIKIFEYDKIIHHLQLREITKNKQTENLETKFDCQDKLSFSTAGTDQNNIFDILDIAAAYVDAKTMGDNKTPLHLSTQIGDAELVDIFLRAGADVDSRDKIFRTPLHYSALMGHKEFVEIFLKAEADVDARDKYKNTPLHYSAVTGHKEVVEILLQAGATVDVRNKYKNTSLHYSAFNGHKEIVKILLKARAAVYAKAIEVLIRAKHSVNRIDLLIYLSALNYNKISQLLL